MVDLSQFLNQTVKVKYRSGETDTVVIEDSGEYGYPYEIEGRTYTKDGLYYKDATDDWDVVEITPINNTSNNNISNNNQMPDTIQDYIDLMIATKEKYGNLKVRGSNEGVGNPDDYYQWDDIKVVTHNSLLSNNGGDDVGYMIFEYC